MANLGYDRALEIETIRRDYFLNVQQGRPPPSLTWRRCPGKAEAVKGIEWLPRLIPEGQGQAPRRTARRA